VLNTHQLLNNSLLFQVNKDEKKEDRFLFIKLKGRKPRPEIRLLARAAFFYVANMLNMAAKGWKILIFYK